MVAGNKYLYIITFFMILWLFSFNIIATVGNHDTRDSGGIGFVSYKVNTNSWMTLSGTTNINSFECISKSGVSGGIIITDSESGNNGVNISDLNLSVDVSSFDCKNPFITRDMYKTLGGDKNSGIDIELIDATLEDGSLSSTEGTFIANAMITINSHSNMVKLMIDWHRSEAMEYHFEGKTDLSMSDFGITPPAPVLGMVKVNDEITVQFNYVVQPGVISRLD